MYMYMYFGGISDRGNLSEFIEKYLHLCSEDEQRSWVWHDMRARN